MNPQNSSNCPKNLIIRLQYLGYFADLDAEIGEALARELREIELSPSGILFSQGDAADGMYILDKGALEVVLQIEDGEEAIIDLLNPGAPLGEMALLSGRPRSASVRATEASKVIHLSQAGYDALVAKYPQFQQKLLDLSVPRFHRTQMAGVLRSFFGDIDKETIHALQELIEWRHVAGGELLFKTGALGDSMAIVVNGRLRITAYYPDGSIKFCSEIGRGQSVGEFALLTGEPRSADVHAVRDTDLLLLSNEVFEQVGLAYPRLGLQLARNIAHKNVHGGRAAAKAKSALSFALLPITPGIDLSEFARQFTAELESLGPTILFTADKFDAAFGKAGVANAGIDDPINVPILGWLTGLEMANEYIVYQADLEDAGWSRRALQQADRIVLVADPTSSPNPSDFEVQLIADYPLARIELLFFHGQSGSPQNSAAWLKTREVGDQYHHLQVGNAADLRRFVRRLVGKPAGLVLSGGAARGFAHIGVYRALRKAGIEIDIFGGTSMGAMVSAGMAADFTDQEMVDLARRYSSSSELLDYTFPASSLFETKKMSRMLREELGDIQIEDLKHPYFCVSSDLTAMRPHIHRNGRLWEAVRASIAIPGVFAPVNYGGNILVDGGLINNLPSDIMRDFCEEGHVIAVDVSPKKEQKREWDFDTSISGWQVLASRLNPFSKPKRVPGLAETVVSSMVVNSSHRLQQAQEHADLLIQLDTSAFGILDLESFEELISLGYESAAPQIDTWLQNLEG